ncbi:MAG: hypothetical protein OXQ29_05995 [Rhodospirillaceae bacterium]|nr:hypothetical protein [Rhodospirillaceae bacterium]
MRVFEAFEAAGYTVTRLKYRIQLRYGESFIGGYNTRRKHWYVRKKISLDRDDLLSRNGFWPQKSWWQLDGEHKADSFVVVVEGLTGAPIEQ